MPRTAATNRILASDVKAALSFGIGVSDKIVVPNNTGQVFNNTDFTITLWYKPTIVGSITDYLFAHPESVGNGNRIYLQLLADNRLGLVACAGGQSTTLKMNIGQWYFIVAKYERSTRNVSLIVNNTYWMNPIASTALVQTTAFQSCILGNQGTAATNSARGIISKMRTFSKLLSDAEASSLYQYDIVPSGLTAQYNLTEGSGLIAYDSSGNGNNGTITGATWTVDTPSKARKLISGNLLPNGDLSYIPVVNTPTTSNAVWIDGTATGSATNSLFSNASYINGTGNVSFDTVNTYNNQPSLKMSVVSTAINNAAWIGPRTTFSASLPIPSELQAYLVPVLPNTSYTISFVWNGNNLATNQAQYNYQTFNGSGTRNLNVGVFGTPTAWTPVSFTVTTGPNDTFLELSFRNGRTGFTPNAADLWVANRSIVANSPLPQIGSRIQVGGNLIQNGDFEYVPVSNVPTTVSNVWINGTSGGSTTQTEYSWYNIIGIGNVQQQLDTAVKVSGNASMRLSAITVTGRCRVMTAPFETTTTPALVAQYGIPVLPSTSYTASCYVKLNNATPVSVRCSVAFFNADGTASGSFNITGATNLGGTQDFTFYTNTGTSGALSAYAIVRFSQEVAGNICDAWVDNIVLTPTTPITRTLVP